jgi:hypothetical protein
MAPHESRKARNRTFHSPSYGLDFSWAPRRPPSHGHTVGVILMESVRGARSSFLPSPDTEDAHPR